MVRSHDASLAGVLNEYTVQDGGQKGGPTRPPPLQQQQEQNREDSAAMKKVPAAPAAGNGRAQQSMPQHRRGRLNSISPLIRAQTSRGVTSASASEASASPPNDEDNESSGEGGAFATKIPTHEDDPLPVAATHAPKHPRPPMANHGSEVGGSGDVIATFVANMDRLRDSGEMDDGNVFAAPLDPYALPGDPARVQRAPRSRTRATVPSALARELAQQERAGLKALAHKGRGYVGGLAVNAAGKQDDDPDGLVAQVILPRIYDCTL